VLCAAYALRCTLVIGGLSEQSEKNESTGTQTESTGTPTGKRIFSRN